MVSVENRGRRNYQEERNQDSTTRTARYNRMSEGHNRLRCQPQQKYRIDGRKAGRDGKPRDGDRNTNQRHTRVRLAALNEPEEWGDTTVKKIARQQTIQNLTEDYAQARLNSWITEDPEMRQYYIGKCAGLTGALYYLGEDAVDAAAATLKGMIVSLSAANLDRIPSWELAAARAA